MALPLQELFNILVLLMLVYMLFAPWLKPNRDSRAQITADSDAIVPFSRDGADDTRPQATNGAKTRRSRKKKTALHDAQVPVTLAPKASKED